MVKAGKTEILPVFTHNLSVQKRNSQLCYYTKRVLPTLGKVFERLVHTQCQKYVTDHKFMSAAQAGFREGRSTGTCLTEFLHNIYAGIDQGCAMGVLFLDLAKAFDSVDYAQLREKNEVFWF